MLPCALTVCGIRQPQDTHGPSDVPRQYLQQFEATISDPVRRQLAAKLSVLDELIKNVTDALAAKGMLKDTLVVYTAVRRCRAGCRPVVAGPSSLRTVLSWNKKSGHTAFCACGPELTPRATSYWLVLHRIMAGRSSSLFPVTRTPSGRRISPFVEASTMPMKAGFDRPLGSRVGHSMLRLSPRAEWRHRRARRFKTPIGA